MGRYHLTTVKPNIPVATQIQSDKTDLPFSANDILWDWHAFDIPKGANYLKNIQVIVRGEDGASQTARDLYVYFAKTDKYGNAPASLGTGNAATSTIVGGFQNQLLGALNFDGGTGDLGGADQLLTSLIMASYSGGDSGFGHGGLGLVLQGEPDSGTNVGYDKIYMAGIAGAGNTWDFSTGTTVSGAQAEGLAATATTGLLVTGTSALLNFSPGDVLKVHDSDTALGTVRSVIDATHIQFESTIGEDAANTDEVINATPITLQLHFER